ncbi:MAG TPA: hypothetical protein VK752_05230 [Bryobacteraceae bacterium]|nr:hypothetical protein [Bryobacteraceae bacterium]
MSKPKSNSDPMGVLPSRLSKAETARREEETRAERAGLPDLEMNADDLDKQIDQKWSLDESEYTQASNPMLDCVNRFKAEYGAAANGMSFKFFTPVIAAESGTENYERCLDRNGNPYTVGLDWMGMIPTRIADARKEKARKESQELVTASEQRFGDGVERLKSEAGKLGMVLTTSGGVDLGQRY